MKKAIAAVICMALFIGYFYVKNSQTRTIPALIPDKKTVRGNSSAIALGMPVTLKIPRLEIDAKVEKVGLDENKNMDVPKDPQNAAWYQLGYLPGQQGSAVIAGHFDTPTGAPAVFYRLGNLENGDEIQITDEKNETLTFIVTGKENYPYDNFPLTEVFGPHEKQVLNLITCEGTFLKDKKSYSHRTVVYSELKK